MRQRLRNVVARKPGEMVLVAKLELDFGELPLAIMETVGTAEPGLLHGHDVADRAVVDSFDGLSIAGMIAALQPGHDAQLLLLGQGASGCDLANADRIEGMRLFHEGVLAGLDGRPEVDGMIFGRTGDEHHVHALDHVTVRVQAGKAVSIVNLDLLRFLLLEHLPPALHPIGEDVGQGHQPHAAVDVHGVDGRAGATAAAANHADADHVAAGGMCAAGQRQSADRRQSGRSD